MLNKEQKEFLYFIYKFKTVYREYLNKDTLFLESEGYITINNFRVCLTNKGDKYIELLSIDELLSIRDPDLVESLFCNNLYRANICKLSKEELCIYLVHNNKYIRNLAKEVYDGE
jgi:hypothetical protein